VIQRLFSGRAVAATLEIFFSENNTKATIQQQQQQHVKFE